MMSDDQRLAFFLGAASVADGSEENSVSQLEALSIAVRVGAALKGAMLNSAHRITMARVLLNNAIALDAHGRGDEAIVLLDEYVGAFASSEDANVQVRAPQAQLLKAKILAEQGGGDAALGEIKTALLRLETIDHSSRSELEAAGLALKAEILFRLDREQLGMDGLRDLVARFGDSTKAITRLLVAQALLRRATMLKRREQREESLEDLKELLQRFGGDDQLDIRECVATALGELWLNQTDLGRAAEASRTMDEFQQRFASASEPVLQRRVIMFRLMQAASLAKQRDFTGALKICDQLISRCGDGSGEDVKRVADMAEKLRCAIAYELASTTPGDGCGAM